MLSDIEIIQLALRRMVDRFVPYPDEFDDTVTQAFAEFAGELQSVINENKDEYTEG